MIASPPPAPEVEVDEGLSVGEVEHHDAAFQANKFEAPRCRSFMASEAQGAHLLIVRSWAEPSAQVRRLPGDGGASLEAPPSTGPLVREEPLECPLPHQEVECVDDL